MNEIKSDLSITNDSPIGSIDEALGMLDLTEETQGLKANEKANRIAEVLGLEVRVR